MRIVNHLQELRRARGKTQTQVVGEIQEREGRRPFTRQMLSHWETGRHQPAGMELAILCQYYGVTPGDILSVEPAGPALA